MQLRDDFMIYAQQALDYGVMGTLIVMSIVTLWLFIERMMFYKSVRIEDYTRQLDPNEVPQWHKMVDVGIPLASLKRAFETLHYSS